MKNTEELVAIKRIPKLFDDLIDCKRILREIILLRKLQHQNLIKIIEILQPEEDEVFNVIYLVMEFAQSDLKKLFKSSIFLEPMHIKTLVYNMLCGIKYLHSAEVLHRDLKPANILINDNCSVKICDFGLARSVSGIKSAHLYKYSKKPEKLPCSSKSLKELTKEEEKEEKVIIKPKQKRLLRRKSKMQLKRELTGHVATRWYRAPELILLEKGYTAAIDI